MTLESVDESILNFAIIRLQNYLLSRKHFTVYGSINNDKNNLE